MFAVPEYVLNPLTIQQEKEAKELRPQLEEALVTLLKRTVSELASIEAVKLIEIAVIYPDLTGVDLIGSMDSFLSLPKDASNVLWLGVLSGTPLVLTPVQQQK